MYVCFCTRKIKRLNAPFQLEGKEKRKSRISRVDKNSASVGGAS